MRLISLHIACASLNQTVMAAAHNIRNITHAIDLAAHDGADILCLPELALTGYSADDYFQWLHNKDEAEKWLDLVYYAAEYAQNKSPNLVVCLGFPFWYQDPQATPMLELAAGIHVKNPLYAHPDAFMQHKPFNAVAVLAHGTIQGIAAKSIQPDGAGEYEARQLQPWPDYLGATSITLPTGTPTGTRVPFGKIVLQLGNAQHGSITLHHEICAEGWVGMHAENAALRYIHRLSAQQPLSLILNPSASKPEPCINKPEIRESICISGADYTNGGAYVYCNALGLEAAPIAFEGGAMIAQSGNIIHRTPRYSMQPVQYSSHRVDVPAHVLSPALQQQQQGGVVAHQFCQNPAPADTPLIQSDYDQQWDSIRNTALWLRDYLVKSQLQGFFISLSGGQDSAFGALMITLMVDITLRELARAGAPDPLEAFLASMPHLRYADSVRTTAQQHGQAAGIHALKQHMLTCAYFPSRNSSQATLRAARTLIEGGTTADGVTVAGIGGQFHIVPVQPVVDCYLELFAGMDATAMPTTISMAHTQHIRQQLHAYIQGSAPLAPEVLEHCTRHILSWQNQADDLALQNIQARARLPLAWLFGNHEDKLACVTSNWSEAVAGYWTFGGDGHMGSINILGGIPKSVLRHFLHTLEHNGIDGLPAVPALCWVNANNASAELRPLQNNAIAQFDEDDLMPYSVLDAIAMAIFVEKRTALAAFEHLRTHQRALFPDDMQLISWIDSLCWRWHAAQFKRVAAVITPFLGINTDPHTAIRTTILSDGFRTQRAFLRLHYLQIVGASPHLFTRYSSMHLRRTLSVHASLRNAILETPLAALPAQAEALFSNYSVF